MTIRRYTDRFGHTTHTVDLRIPGVLWRLLRRRGARRDPLEIVAHQVRNDRPADREFDYWSVTEAPTT